MTIATPRRPTRWLIVARRKHSPLNDSRKWQGYWKLSTATLPTSSASGASESTSQNGEVHHVISSFRSLNKLVHRAKEIGTTWRISNDIYNAWRSIWRITNQVFSHAKHTAPGMFADMDMLM